MYLNGSPWALKYFLYKDFGTQVYNNEVCGPLGVYGVYRVYRVWGLGFILKV